ncbi:hypothetical protein EZY14_004235 [Kordia sp. TARA_039_SRF]|nr:hypothetical protein EZY14_004235 [Kordia sp. TARA_039_SRF]
MFPFFHDRKRRRKNRLNLITRISIPIFVYFLGLGIYLLIIDPIARILGLVITVPTALTCYKFYWMEKFLRYADKFENNDMWLPKHYPIEKPPMLKELEQKTFTQTLSAIGNKAFLVAIEKDLTYLHNQKDKIELKQKDWQTVPLPNENDFWDIRKRYTIGWNRTGIYSNYERSEIQREFIRKVSLCDQMIAQANKIHNQLVSKGHEIQNNDRNLSGIDGLNSIES